MKLDRKYLIECYYNAMILQYKDMLIKEGFDVDFETQLKYENSYIGVDLLAKKGTEKRIYEFKYVGNNNKFKSTKDIKEYKKIAEKINAELFVVYINVPHEKQIEFDDLEDIVTSYFRNLEIPNELDTLSTHTSIDCIEIDEIYSIRVNADRYIEVEGNGIIYVNLQYGSVHDNIRGDGFECQESFPLEYKISFNSEQEISNIKYEIDTSSFYE